MSATGSAAESGATDTGKLPPEFIKREQSLIAQRRAAAGFKLGAIDKPQGIGVALSGGGIRSATFCLGLFQSLAKHKLLRLLRRVDYLSTVSGGGYFGGFLGRMFTREWVSSPVLAAGTAVPPASPPPGDPRGHRLFSRERFLAKLRGGALPATQQNLQSGSLPPPDAVARVETALEDSQSPPLIWLRESSNYLAPGGANDDALDISIYLRNWLSMLVVMLTTAFTVFVAVNCLRFSIGFACGQDFEKTLAAHAGAHLWWTPAIALPVLVAAVFLVPLGMGYWLAQAGRKVWAVWVAYPVMFGAGAEGFRHLPGKLHYTVGLVGIMACLAMLWYAGFWVFGPRSGGKPGPWIRNHMARWLRVALLLVAGLFIFALVDGWGQSLYAVTSYAGTWHKAAPAIAGILGMTALAPLVRSLALKGIGASGRFKLPLQFLALAFSLVLALTLFTGLAFVSHGLAWGWNLPHCSRSELPADSPGGSIYNHWCVESNSVQLTADRLIQVAPAENQAHPGKAQEEPTLGLLLATLLVSGLLSWLFGRNLGFLNLSSYHTLYSARITRAYQGASNQKRWDADADVTISEADDDIEWSKYDPHAHGGPLHLVNCTINCTESVETAMESTTAKGLNLCVGPAGISYGRNHAVFSTDFASVTPFVNGELAKESDPVEPLALGDWVGISGAAFTTGLGNVGGGRGTTLGTSLLCGLFNVRLGYWWQNHFSPSHRLSANHSFPVQTYLADEFTASFHIVERDHWYLSDGGHFENTAAYELIRRRVPFIILADCGADPDGAFDDLGNLVRRVRIDFGAEIIFPEADEVAAKLGEDSDLIGSLPDLRPEDESTDRPGDNCIDSASQNMQAEDAQPFQVRRMKKHAAIAEVRYPEGGTSTILVIKPGLTGDEPEDLLNYQRNNVSFPQQSTLDQFYDEAQWESYRKLGEHAMETVLEDAWLRKQFA